MNAVLQKTLAVIVAIVVFALIVVLTDSLEELYQSFFPDLPEPVLRSVMAISKFVGLALAVILSIEAYKRLAATRQDRCDRDN